MCGDGPQEGSLEGGSLDYANVPLPAIWFEALPPHLKPANDVWSRGLNTPLQLVNVLFWPSARRCGATKLCWRIS